MIHFNVPSFVGSEFIYMKQAIDNHKICGDGPFTKKGDACFKENGHNMNYFYEHEQKSQFTDFHIIRYLAELKMNLEKSCKLIGGGTVE